MTITLSSLAANTQTWAQTPSTADVSVTLDGAARTLTGMAAAAYLFGQALTTVQFQDTLDGVQLTDARFEFPPASEQRVTLSEMANALRYKYGVDPLIEFAPGLGARGYSIPDINRILELLNREFAGQFSLVPVSGATVLTATQAEFNAANAAETAAAYASVGSYLTDLSTKATALRDFYTARRDDAVVRVAWYQGRIDKRTFVDPSDAFTSGRGNAQASATKYQNYLDEINSRLGMIDALKTSVSNGGDDFNTVLSGYRTASITDVFAELKKCDVDPSLLWNAPQSFVTFNGYPLADPAEQMVAIILDWSDVQFGGIFGSVQPIDITRSGKETEIYAAISAAERNEEFGEFDWERWKAGNEVVKGNLAQTSNFWTSQNISENLTLEYLPNGYTDAAFAGTTYAPYAAAAVSTLLNTAGTFGLAPATDTELRQNLTEGGDLYTDRFGAFYLNRVRTQAMDVAVTSRLLVQDNVAAEYKLLMDELAERNNLIAAARTVMAGAVSNVLPYSVVSSLSQQYGFADVLGTLTAGQYLDADLLAAKTVSIQKFRSNTADDSANTVSFNSSPWPTGTRVRLQFGTAGLEGGRDYFVRLIRPGTYELYESEAKAMSGNQIVDILGGVTADFYSPDELAFSLDPAWPSGTRVRVAPNDGGLARDTDYFVRNLGDGRYSFYDSKANAIASTSTTGRVALTAPITANVTYTPTSAADFTAITALLNTLISNKVRDGDLDQAKLQTLTAQLQNNTEAMTALIKAFTEMNAQLAQALR